MRSIWKPFFGTWVKSLKAFVRGVCTNFPQVERDWEGCRQTVSGAVTHAVWTQKVCDSSQPSCKYIWSVMSFTDEYKTPNRIYRPRWARPTVCGNQRLKRRALCGVSLLDVSHTQTPSCTPTHTHYTHPHTHMHTHTHVISSSASPICKYQSLTVFKGVTLAFLETWLGRRLKICFR